MGKDCIVLISNTDLRNIGGAQASILNMYEFRPPGFDNIFSPWINISPFSLPDGLNTARSIRTGALRIPFTGHQLPAPMGVRNVRSEVETLNPRYIILNQPDFYSSTLFFALSPELRARTYAIWRGMVRVNPKILEDTTSVRKAMRSLIWRVLEHVRKAVGNLVIMNFALSQASAESLASIGIKQDKIITIPEQIGGEFNPQLRINYNEALRRQFLDPDELGILVVGRISPEKGLGWVMDLYDSLRHGLRYLNPDTSFRRVRISIVGDAISRNNGYLDNLKRKQAAIESNTNSLHNAEGVELSFLGGKGRGELQELYNAYDILFMPSPAEGFGRVTVEALSAGMTVIGRDECAATKEILDQPPYTIGITVQSPQEAAAEIFYLMNNTGTLKEMQDNAYQWAEGHYSLAQAEIAFWQALGWEDQNDAV